MVLMPPCLQRRLVSGSDRDLAETDFKAGASRISINVTTAFSLQQHEATHLYLYNFQLMSMKHTNLRPLLCRASIRRRICIARNYAVQTPGNPTLQIFSRNTKWLQKERAAADVEHSRKVDYLKDEVAMR